ncbi:MAG: translocation protein S66 [Chaenotheca gracillima]|nr:MAG: translocation protein S66 [Chaenotheca gracillima]
MPPSQLKRLKASLRAEGVTGPQQSKKQKKKNQTNGTANEKRAQRGSALQKIREQFNPFEVKEPSRGKDKFEVTRLGQNGKVAKGVKGRPGVTKGLGEEVRKRTLLKDIESRNKIGGIRDRRFGENDPTMTPEEKMLERFTMEKQRRMKNESLFNLEDDQQDQLTHMGQSLSFDTATGMDDFDEADLRASDEESGTRVDPLSRKRRRSSLEDSDDRSQAEQDSDDEPERKKSKAEVMKEVIAKSKLYKYERQEVKEQDEDVREELDKELPELLALLRGKKPTKEITDRAAQESSMNPERAALMIANLDKGSAEYDKRLREMAMDQRSMPTERTKTEEEKAEDEATRLQELEQSRQRRMKGEEEESEDEDQQSSKKKPSPDEIEDDEADDFGLGTGLSAKALSKDAKLEEEDEFVIDEDLVASASDIATSESDDSEESDGLEEQDQDQGFSDGDDEFTRGLLSEKEIGRPEFEATSSAVGSQEKSRGLAYTYACPQTLEEFIQILEGLPSNEIPIVVQRIRALYHPKLHADNRSKLSTFSKVLVHYLAHLTNSPTHPPFALLETLTRHIHSLAKTYPEDVSNAFRLLLEEFQEKRPLAPLPGDLVALAAIGSIFPTSDHFHQVVTPANLCISRYLSQKLPRTLSDLSKGSWIQTVYLQYQRLSKRYMPEVANYTMNAISILSPVKPNLAAECFPFHEPASSLRIQASTSAKARDPQFWDADSRDTPTDDEGLKTSLLETQLSLVDAMVSLWASKPAMYEVFSPILRLTQLLDSQGCRSKLAASTKTKVSATANLLKRQLQQSALSRRPLTLHNHRPLPIKTSIPKFEEQYDLNKHYDPNRDRAELSKLRAEHKRERKGAMRELRKDANFIARESLKEKKERDQEYEKKYKRLVAEIQGEEGKEANQYEREKRMRKAKR